MKVLFSCFNFGKSSLRLHHVGGILGNAAFVAVTMVVLLNFNQVTQKGHVWKHRGNVYSGNGTRKLSKLPEGMLSMGSSGKLDVLFARG